MHRAFALTLTGCLYLGTALAQPASCTLPAGLQNGTVQASETRAVIVLDTSGSMRGIGDGQANIFDRVKGSIAKYVEQASPQRLELLTFDSGIRHKLSYNLPADAATFERDLKALQADGRNTHLYRSLQAALAPLTASERYVTNVFVLTDGIDNDHQRRATPQSALNAFKHGPLDTLTYIALGTDIPNEARRALTDSDYASGLTLPVGQVPDLSAGGYGTGVATVTDPGRVPAPFPDGTPLTLSAESGLELTQRQASGGRTSLRAPARLPFSTPALLCAPPLAQAGRINAPPRRVLLTLNLGSEGSGMRWLNPGADRALKPGEEVVLRYQAAPTLNLDGPQVGIALPAGTDPTSTDDLSATLERLPGAREFAVRLKNQLEPSRQGDGQLVSPRLVLASGRSVELPAVTLGTGSTPPAVPPALVVHKPDPAEMAGKTRLTPGLIALLVGLLALLGGVGYWLMLRRATRIRPRPAKTPSLTSTVPTIEGIQYDEDRVLSLVAAGGQTTLIQTPLGGPFDLGQQARVPHLSGFRVQHHRDGLQVLHLPQDLDVSQGTRLLQEGDIVRPGTLLGVAVSRPVRAPHASLGSLVGLGLPLTFKTDGVTLQILGPYGVHSLTLTPGITDLGEEFRAPALYGLKLGTSGPNILLADVPAGMTLNRTGDDKPLKPGTYLPPETRLTLPQS